MIPPDGDVFEEMLEEDEEGLAAERTDLAWGRSGLSVIACGVAILKGVPGLREGGSEPWAGVVVLSMGAAVWLMGLYEAHKRKTAPGEWRPVAELHDVALISAGTAAVGLAGALLILFVPG